MSGEKEVRRIGQGHTGGTIQIYWINREQMCYCCTLCDMNYIQELDEQDCETDWFRFECPQCGEQSKRTVNMSRFLASPQTAVEPAPAPAATPQTKKEKGKKKQ